jgi:hypothetical protein
MHACHDWPPPPPNLTQICHHQMYGAVMSQKSPCTAMPPYTKMTAMPRSSKRHRNEADPTRIARDTTPSSTGTGTRAESKLHPQLSHSVVPPPSHVASSSVPLSTSKDARASNGTKKKIVACMLGATARSKDDPSVECRGGSRRSRFGNGDSYALALLGRRDQDPRPCTHQV